MLRRPSPLPTTFLALVLLWGIPLFAQVDDPAEGAETESEPSEIRHREKVTVAASGAELLEGPRGGSVSIIEPTEAAGMPTTLAEMVTELPGVAMNGQGGLFQMISIRGVSRLRVTSMISGMRLASDRRAGVSVSFVDPLLMGSAQVIRGPATTFHGSGALGGVMQVQPRDFQAPSVDAGYGENGNERFLAFGIGGQHWSASLANRRADNAQAGDGTLLNTRFNQYSAVLQGNWKHENWSWEILAVPTYAKEIGKSNSDFPERTTRYPLERHGLVEATLTAPSGWRLRAYVHGQDLETDVFEAGVSHSQVSTGSFDFGARFENGWKPDGGPDLLYGVESFNRRNVDAVERIEDLDPVSPVAPQTTQSLDGASLDELGAYCTVTWDWGPTTWQGGGRASAIRQSNRGIRQESGSALNGFVGFTWPVVSKLELRTNVDSGLRFPSLSELFFTGTTGRGEVIGNPTLDSERSLNTEVSLRWLGRRVYANGVLFRTRITDYIERVEIAPDLLTWVNLTSGTIRGVELDLVYMLGERWRVFGSGFALDGTSSDDTPLADIPPGELRVGGRRRHGRWGFETSLAYRSPKSDPGSGEQEIADAWLFGATLDYSPTPRWKISLSGINLLDQTYYPAADRKAALAPGRSIAVRLSWTGG